MDMVVEGQEGSKRSQPGSFFKGSRKRKECVYDAVSTKATH